MVIHNIFALLPPTRNTPVEQTNLKTNDFKSQNISNYS